MTEHAPEVRALLVEIVLSGYSNGRKIRINGATPISREILLRAWLGYLRSNPVTIKEVAAAVARTPASIWRHVNILEEQTLIELTSDPRDHRRKIINVTQFGLTMLQTTYQDLFKLFEPLESFIQGVNLNTADGTAQPEVFAEKEAGRGLSAR